MTALDIRVNPAVSDPSASTSFGIGELSARTGVSARSLRYYEEQGLLAPDRTRAGHRRFDAEAVDRVLLIQRLFAAGLTSVEIAPLLPPLLGRSSPLEPGQAADRIASLRTHRREIAQRIARLQDTAEILDEVLEEHADTV